MAFPIRGIETSLYHDVVTRVFQTHTQKILDRYDPVKYSNNAQRAVSAINGDLYFQTGSLRLAKAFASKGHRTYKYLFDHKPLSGIQTLGAYHAAELCFVFQTAPGGFIFPS